MNQKKQKPRRQKHIPQRTCVICRQKFDKRRLTRIVRTADSGVIIDPTGKQNGRGAYLCDQPACWERALRNSQLLNKALLTTISEDEWAALAAHKPESVNNNE